MTREIHNKFLQEILEELKKITFFKFNKKIFQGNAKSVTLLTKTRELTVIRQPRPLPGITRPRRNFNR